MSDRNYSRLKESNHKKDSDASSDRLSLNNVNHLRRNLQQQHGYAAPVNSDVDFGSGGGDRNLFAAVKLPPDDSLASKGQLGQLLPAQLPKTSSPAGSSVAAPAFKDQVA